MDRLLSAGTNGVGNGQYSESYQYNAIGNLTSKAGVTQWYSDTLHKHAVTHLGGIQKFWYDSNGNMTKRIENGVTYTQTWDAENRMQVVTVTSGSTMSVTKFVYDGDSARVMQIYSGTYMGTTVYIGDRLEVAAIGAPPAPPTVTIPPTMTHRFYLPLVIAQDIPRSGPLANETWKLYYSAGNQLIAMRSSTTTGDTLYYLSSDHLGSTSPVMNDSGTKTGEMRYKPYGEIRYTWGVSPTNRQFTGQYADASGLMYFRARYFSPVAGRFVSADTVMPDPLNPQAWNRYSYVINNPLKYSDPTGYYICTAGINILSTACRQWVEDALGQLANAGKKGLDLVSFFRTLDSKEGIEIHFQELINDALLAPPVGNTIALPQNFLQFSPANNKNAVALFGHEIVHLGQSAAERLSMLGELEAFQTEHILRDNFHIGQTDFTRAAWGQGKTPDNLNSLSDLAEAASRLRNVQNSPYTWQPNVPSDASPISQAARWYAFYKVTVTAQQTLFLGAYGISKLSEGVQNIIKRFEQLFGGP